MKKSIFIGSVFVAIVMGITLGIIVHLYNDEKVAQYDEKQAKEMNMIEENKSTIKVSNSETKIGPNAILVLETYYTKCGHSAIKEQQIKESDVNKNKEEFQKEYSEWKIKKFDTDRVELYRELNEICNKHYIIKENDGYITVYSIDSNGKETLKNKTEIVTQYLPEGDRQLLKNGIKANGDLELSQKLSDFE